MIRQLEELISDNKIEEAIRLLSDFLKDSPKLNDVIQQSARYKELLEHQNRGIIEFEVSIINKNKIIVALLQIKEEIKNQIDKNKELKDEYTNRRFHIDKQITSVLEILGKRREENTDKLVPLEILIPTLDSLFERMTFRGEPKIEMCTKQRWIERVHSAQLTYEALLTFAEDFHRKGSEFQRKIFSELLISISKYIDRMLLGLFEESKIHLEEVDHLIGTPDFVIKFKENVEKKFQLSEDGSKIVIEDKFRKPINTHLKNTLSNFETLKKTLAKNK